MAEQQFTANLSRTQGRSAWCIIFRHPIRRDSQGRIGLRIRRGLGTNDRNEAEKLRDQMNELLSQPAWWTPTARENAERFYDRRIVSAFYDYLTPPEHDFWERRERIIPLPTPENGYTRVLFIGTTGAGKTTLVRQFLGTDPKKEHFPSTSTAKTTVSDIEIVFVDATFQAVVSFFSKDTIQVYVEECIVAAVLAAMEDRTEQDIARKLLEHSDQRFRLSYILGNFSTPMQEEVLVDEGDEELADDIESDELAPEDRQHNIEVLQQYLNEIRYLAGTILKDLENHSDFPHNVDDKNEYDAQLQELLEQELYKYPAFQELVDEVIDAIEARFTFLQRGIISQDAGGWPSYWTYKTEDRSDFLKTINWFSSNNASLFGHLLTPLVQGIRVAGPFQPEWSEHASPHLVLMDGEGLGHTSDTATSLSTRITSRFEYADAIVLVDNATQPLQAASAAAIKSIETGGHGSKLFVCFTHFDGVKGDNLPDISSKRLHVRSSLENEITSLSKELGRRTSIMLRNTLEDRVFFVSNIQNKLSEKAKATRAELNRLLKGLEDAGTVVGTTEVRPVYDDTYLLLFIQRAVKSFRESWRGRLNIATSSNRYPEHWTRIKALARRPAKLGLDEYETLRPVADLIRELSEQMRGFLNKPSYWQPNTSVSEEMQQEAIDTIAREMYVRFHKFARKRLIREQLPVWETAYSRMGTGSARVRARDIDSIYNSAAPFIDEVGDDDIVDNFLDDVVQLIREAVKAGGGQFF